MQFTLQELKEQLLRAVDADNNVVDMSIVLEVLSILEKYPVTKEQLEQTRIGRLVNDIRRKTSNRDLARRAKNLVRKWRDLVSLSHVINGESRLAVGGAPPVTQCNSVPAHLHQGLGSKPASPVSRPGTPSSGKSSISPTNSHHAASTVAGSRPSTPSIHSRLSPRLSTSKPVSPLAGSVNNICKHSTCDSPKPWITGEQATTSCEMGKTSWSHEAVSKGNVANKRKRRSPADTEVMTPSKYQLISDANSNSSYGAHKNGSDDGYRKAINGVVSAEPYSKSSGPRSYTSQSGSATSSYIHGDDPSRHGLSFGAQSTSKMSKQNNSDAKNICTPTLDVSSSHVDGSPSVSSNKFDHGSLDRGPLAVRTPKVKTTAELIQDLHNRAGMRLSGSKTVTKIAMNQIEKEPDILTDTVVPPEAKPRHRRKPASTVAPPAATRKSLSKTKTEMVEKFLQSSVQDQQSLPTHSTSSLMDLIKQESLKMDSESARNAEVTLEEDSQSSFISVPSEPGIQLSAKEPPDPWSLLPPLDLDDIDLSNDSYEVREREPVTEQVVDQLLTEHWPGVNGQFDSAGQWHNWKEVYSVPSAGDNLLHILPYVCLD